MKSFTGKFASARGWALLLALLLGAGMMVSACGDEEVPAPTTPTPPPPPPAPAPAPEPEPEPEPDGPATPENLRVSATTSSSITWMWDAVEGAIGYQGQFSEDTTFTDTDQTFLILAPATSHTVANLAGRMTGHFRVRSGAGTAITDLTFSDWTDGVSGTTEAPPAATALAAPGGLNAGNAEDDSITLGWSAVDDAESYEVQQRAGDAVNYSPASCDGEGSVVEETACIVTDLESGTDYDFRVRGLPADDDDAHVAGAWGTTSGTTTGSGPATTTVTPGGMGALNLRWHNAGDNNDDIVFVWDRQGAAMYETVVLAIEGTDAANLEVVANVSVENPCKDVNDTDSSDVPRYTSVGSATSQSIDTSALGPGTIRGLCVREEDSSEASFAWGISPAEEPNVGTEAAGTITVEDDVTTELAWTGVNLKKAFDYEIHLAADPERPDSDNNLDNTSAINSRAVQAACEAGRQVDAFTPDIDLTGRTVREGGLSPHTGYLLCIRASNGTGTGAWSAPIQNDADNAYGTNNNEPVQETFTRPAAPPSIGSPSSRSVAATGTANEKLAPTWEINTRTVSNVPRNAADFNVAVFAQAIGSPDADALRAADCHATTAPTGYELVNSTKPDGLSGFEVVVANADAIERVGFTRRVYVCAQANSGSANGLGTGPWRISSAFSVARPSGISLSSSDVLATSATLTIKNWNRGWYYKADASGTATDLTCSSQVTADNTSLTLEASTSYAVSVWDDSACEGNRLATTTVRTPAP